MTVPRARERAEGVTSGLVKNFIRSGTFFPFFGPRAWTL